MDVSPAPDSPDFLSTGKGNLEWLDCQTRTHYAQWYQEVIGNGCLEEKSVEKKIDCSDFKARLLSQVCMLRKKMPPSKVRTKCKLPTR